MLSREWLSAFVPIGVLRSPTDWDAIGAGVLFHDPPVVWLITAAHVVKGARGREIAPLVTHAQGGVVVIQLNDIQSKLNYGWHLDELRDIAATLMPVNKDWQIKAIDEKLCIKMDDLVPSMQCYTVRCPYGVRGFDPQRSTPTGAGWNNLGLRLAFQATLSGGQQLGVIHLSGLSQSAL